MTQPWNMARAASHRRPHRRSVMQPVGAHNEQSEFLGSSCRGCGHHICSCLPVAKASPTLADADAAGKRLYRRLPIRKPPAQPDLPPGWFDDTARTNEVHGTNWGAVFCRRDMAWTVGQFSTGAWFVTDNFDGIGVVVPDWCRGLYKPDRCWAWLRERGHL